MPPTMTLYLDAADVMALATGQVIMDAVRAAMSAERNGLTSLPPRLDVDHAAGFLRVMPAAIEGITGLKVMTLAKGHGTRYIVLVYDRESGELVAMLDADEITRLRTAATTAVAGEMLAPGGTTRLGLVGSGFEAEGHLRLLASLWPLERVLVYSRSAERRRAFVVRMASELSIDVRAVDSVTEAVATVPVTVLATRSTEPVVAGGAFPRGAVVLSIGSTRLDLRELDRETLARAALLLVDDAAQVCQKSGDVIDALASGALDRERIVPMSAMPMRSLSLDGTRDLLAFKSVGTAVHDLSLAAALIAAARQHGRGRELGELTRLKPFAELASRPGRQDQGGDTR